MPGPEYNAGTSFKKEDEVFKDVVRKNGMGWTPDKYARMGIYVYLYNRIKGRPKEFGLEDEDVSFRIRDLIVKEYDYLIKRFRIDQVEEIDFTDPKEKERFIRELDEYNQHAMEIDSNMPSTKRMNEFMEYVAVSRSKNFSALHASVKDKPGEFYKDGDASKGKFENGYLIVEKIKKEKEIKNISRRIRIDSGWTALKGVGALGSAGLAIVSGIAMFSPAILGLGPAFAASFLTRAVIGVVGIGFGFTGFRQFGSSFTDSFAKVFGMRRKRRNMIYEDGEHGKRGLKAIEREIKLHQDLKQIYIRFKDMGKDGKLPTKEEFMAYVKKHFPKAYNNPRASLDQLYKEAGYFTSSKTGGVMRGVMEFMMRNEVSVVKNDQIAIERDDVYNAAFNRGTGIAPDGKVLTMEQYYATLKDLKADKETTYKTMHREYREHERNASNALLNVYKNEIFELPFSQKRARSNAAMLEDADIKDMLERNPSGPQTRYITNAVEFVKNEARLDKTQGFQLDDTVQASVKAQLTRKAEDMTEACVKLGVEATSAEYATVTSIANSIEGMKLKSEAANILSTINSSSINEEAKAYLRKMVGFREKESLVAPGDLQAALGYSGSVIPANSHKEKIFTTIKSLKRISVGDQITLVGEHNNVSYNLDQIRKLISEEAYINKIDGTYISVDEWNAMDPTNQANYTRGKYLTDDEIKNVTALLEEQRNAIENRHRNEVRDEAYKVISEGGVRDKLDELMDTITKLQYEDIADDGKKSAFHELWSTKIIKANPKELSEYLTMRVKQRLEESILQKLNDPTRYTNPDGLDLLAKDLNIIVGSIYLDQSQKDRIIAKIEEKHLVRAFENELLIMEKYILKDFATGKNEFRDKLMRYFELPYAKQGFKDLFGKNGRSSPAINSIKDRLSALNIGIELQGYLSATAEGVQRSIDPDSGETRAILRVLFRKNENDEVQKLDTQELAKEIKGLVEQIQSKGMKGLLDGKEPKGFELDSDGNKIAAKGDSVIKTISDYVTNIDTKALDVDQKLALLLIAKKNALTYMKAHLKKFITGPNPGTEEQFIRTTGAGQVEAIKNAWKELCKQLDDKIEEIARDSDCFYAIEGNRIGRAQSTLDSAVSVDKMVKYVNSPFSEVENGMGGPSA